MKSLVRFKSVCKSWDTLISDPSFISTHLEASLSNNTPFILLVCARKIAKQGFLYTMIKMGLRSLSSFNFLLFPACSVPAIGLLSVNNYVESLVLLDKTVDVRCESDVNHPIYSSDSGESSGGESGKSSLIDSLVVVVAAGIIAQEIIGDVPMTNTGVDGAKRGITIKSTGISPSTPG
ncbi:hypothetical protein V6N12_045969 [Hibiscus sabdariffa]|uniref:Uncharacterized protein n=1 Tax=Hibiscus sabdariffa TaxID=183260 RepID=A0ABR2G476_9ROSI